MHLIDAIIYTYYNHVVTTPNTRGSIRICSANPAFPGLSIMGVKKKKNAFHN